MGSRVVIGNECAPWGSKITSLPLPSPLSGFTEQNHVKTTEENMAKLYFLVSIIFKNIVILQREREEGRERETVM